MKIRILLLTILTVNSFYSLGQGNNTEAINQATKLFCECASEAKDKNEFEICGEKIKSLDSLQLSETEKLYFLDRLKSECGDLLTKFLGDRPAKRIEVPKCSFLIEDDLKIYDLQKSNTDKVSVQWTGKSEKQIVKGLIDHRSVFPTNDKAIVRINEHTVLASSVSEKTTRFANDFFQSVDAYNLGKFGNSLVYQVFARKDNTVFFLTIDMSSDDISIVDEIINKLTIRAKKCH